MTTLIITDLTRFSGSSSKVCTAGTAIESGKCIRPMPYIPMSECQRLELLPGSKLTGTFRTPTPAPTAPHLEDRVWENLRAAGTATPQEFLWALQQGLRTSVWEGFDGGIAVGTKELLPPFRANRSIITLQVAPSNVELVVDTYKADSIRVHFTDRS